MFVIHQYISKAVAQNVMDTAELVNDVVLKILVSYDTAAMGPFY